MIKYSQKKSQSMAENIYQRNFPVARYLSPYNLKFGFVCFLPLFHTQKPQRSVQSKHRPHEKALVTLGVITNFNVHHLRCKPTAGFFRVCQCTNISSRKSISKARKNLTQKLIFFFLIIFLKNCSGTAI